MERNGLSFSRLADDDDWAWRVLLCAGNGSFGGALEFYINPKELSTLGRRLAAFPRKACDEVRLELGSRAGNMSHYLLIRAFVFNRSGHTALEISIDNRQLGTSHADASFAIPCEPASLNHLGRKLCAWVEQPSELLVWTACLS